MEVLAGSFGKGRFSIDAGRQSISINGILISFAEIVSVQDKTIANPSNTRSLGVATAAGYLLTGPVGGLAGLALGALSEKKGHVIFEIVIAGGKYALVRGSFDSFGAVRAAVGDGLAGKATTQPVAATSDVWRSRTILGRASRCAPTLAFNEIREAHSSLVEGTHLEAWNSLYEKFFERISIYAEILNDVKWRYFDSVLSPREIERCSIFALHFLRREFTENVRKIEDSAYRGAREPETLKPVFPDSLKELIEDGQFKLFQSKEQKTQLQYALKEFEKYKLALVRWEEQQNSEEEEENLSNQQAFSAALLEVSKVWSAGERYVRAFLAFEAYPNEVWDIWSEVCEEKSFVKDVERFASVNCAVNTEFDATGNRMYTRIDGELSLEEYDEEIYEQAQYNEFVLGILKRYILVTPLGKLEN